MPHQYDPSIHLNQHGEPDLEYYVAEARRLRRSAISEIFADLVRWPAMALGFSAPHREDVIA